MKISNTKLSSSAKILAAILGLFMLACASTGKAEDGAAPVKKSGSELWAQNCRRCHNFRSPSDLSDAGWDAAMFHMRVRANLTGDEYRSILQFLKSSN